MVYKILYSNYNDGMSKARIVILLDILRKYSNESHPLNADAIAGYLRDAGEEADRRTIYSDIAALRNAGYEIEDYREGWQYGYYYSGQPFDNAELRLMADGINGNSFLTERKTDAMLDKLLSLTSIYDRKVIEKTLSYRHPKTNNEQILYNIDALQQALYERKEVSFRYFDYDIKGTRKYRRSRQNYCSVPYAIIWNQERYYMIGYSLNHEDFTHFRIDKMENITAEDTAHQFVEFDARDYVQRTFGMYGGTLREVKLRCRSIMAGELLDQFSNYMLITSSDDSYIELSVRIRPSPVFYSWLFQYGQDVEILYPQDVREQYRQLALKEAQRYENGF